MRSFHIVASTSMLALLAMGCKETTRPGDRITSTLTCEQPDRQFAECSLQLQENSGFQVTLSRIVTCRAHGNEIRLTKPVQVVLTEDACYAGAGTVWTYNGPYPAGTEISLEISSERLQFPAGLRVSGAYPQWTINFEDGGDQDFDDLQLAVQALPQQ